jgi:nitrate reductase NapE component
MYVTLTPLCLPPMQKRFGINKTLFYIFCAWPVLAITVPIAQWLAGNARWLMWITVALQLALKSFGNFSWP